MLRLGAFVVLLAGCGGAVDHEPPQEPVLVDFTRDEDARDDAGGGTFDAGATDAGATDAGATDAGATDAGTRLRVVVLSDLNGSYGSTTYEPSVHQAIAALRATVRPDLVLIAGDMVAGQQAGLDFPAMWAAFHAAVTTPLLDVGIPVAPAPGNHDASAYPGYGQERAEYARQWEPLRRPAVQLVDASQFPFRYSFSFRGAFFIALDATTVAPLSTSQRTWVGQQLAGASAFPVKLVFGHVPLHPTTVGRETQVLSDPPLEAILRQHGALFVGGHQHGYYPGAANGVRHVVTPCIGSGPRALIGSTVPSPRGFVVVDVAGGRVTSVEAFTGAGFSSRILRGSLPPRLDFGSHRLERDDLAGF
ncbi:MAG: metallophosphoesterase [Myxococcaceae bacterium]|nr:metallophosphoesterase [Myxococcaceae bacterium]